MIREAAAVDVPRIVAMGRRFLAETSYRGVIAENPGQMVDLAHGLVTSDVGVLLVSEEGGALTGMLGAFLFDHPISGERIATELFWWVEPEHRGHGIRLLKRAEQWAKANGAGKLQMIAPTPAVARIYEALHYTPIETSYQRAL